MSIQMVDNFPPAASHRPSRPSTRSSGSIGSLRPEPQRIRGVCRNDRGKTAPPCAHTHIRPLSGTDALAGEPWVCRGLKAAPAPTATDHGRPLRGRKAGAAARHRFRATRSPGFSRPRLPHRQTGSARHGRSCGVWRAPGAADRRSGRQQGHRGQSVCCGLKAGVGAARDQGAGVSLPIRREKRARRSSSSRRRAARLVRADAVLRRLASSSSAARMVRRLPAPMLAALPRR